MWHPWPNHATYRIDVPQSALQEPRPWAITVDHEYSPRRSPGGLAKGIGQRAMHPPSAGVGVVGAIEVPPDPSPTDESSARVTVLGHVLWTYHAPELYELLVLERGWSAARHREFITSALTDALLASRE